MHWALGRKKNRRGQCRSSIFDVRFCTDAPRHGSAQPHRPVETRRAVQVAPGRTQSPRHAPAACHLVTRCRRRTSPRHPPGHVPDLSPPRRRTGRAVPLDQTSAGRPRSERLRRGAFSRWIAGSPFVGNPEDATATRPRPVLASASCRRHKPRCPPDASPLLLRKGLRVHFLAIHT